MSRVGGKGSICLGKLFASAGARGQRHVTLAGKSVVVVGASRGIGKLIVSRMIAEDAQVLAIGRQQEPLADLAREMPGTITLAMDAASDGAPSRAFTAIRPDVLIICAGARPRGGPLHELTWPEFAANWESDVKISFLFCREALRTPMAPGSTVILISSGAALGGSPMTGGYAGAKRTQMFIANYAQKESNRMNLGVRFLALAPALIMPETALGQLTVECYARYLNMTPEDFVQCMDSRQTPEDVANATVELASNSAAYRGSAFTISCECIVPVG
jgi:NAD(P)-dependent dehydrogenase (short-subunit alcohol dehydrogenase family)